MKLMQMASQETEQKLNQHELRAKKEWESTYAKSQREEEMKMQALMAQNDHELEQSRLTDLARIQAQLQEQQNDLRRRQEQVLFEQSRNPLGMRYNNTSSSVSITISRPEIILSAPVMDSYLPPT